MPSFEDMALDSEPAPDKDDFSDPISTFPSMYHQQSSVAMGLEKCYVLHLAQCGERLCGVSDTGTLGVYTMDTLTKTDTLVPHTMPVTGLTSRLTEPDLVLTSSSDGTVAVWDLRLSSHLAVQTLSDTSKHSSGPPATGTAKPLSCLAVNSAGLVAAGTEQVGGDTFVLFWDTRAGTKLLGGYWDTHSDDITTKCS